MPIADFAGIAPFSNRITDEWLVGTKAAAACQSRIVLPPGATTRRMQTHKTLPGRHCPESLTCMRITYAHARLAQAQLKHEKHIKYLVEALRLKYGQAPYPRTACEPLHCIDWTGALKLYSENKLQTKRASKVAPTVGNRSRFGLREN